MLVELTITNLAIIERTSIQFEEGLNALTGETGAGKSILLDALGAVLGQRVSADLVRSGAKSARVEATFDVPGENRQVVEALLLEYGVEHDADELLVFSRDIMASGRSTARINGRIVNASQASTVGEKLVDIHGQSDHLSILRSSEQRLMLDRFAGLDALREEVATLVGEWRMVRDALSRIDVGAREREQRLDYLRFQLAEIDDASLVVGEDAALARERDLLQNADHIRLEVESAVTALVGDESGMTEVAALPLLRKVQHTADSLVEMDSDVDAIRERAIELTVLAEDLARDLRGYLEGVDGDPERLQVVDDRLDVINTLKRKYGTTIEDVLSIRDAADDEIQKLTGSEYDATELTEKLASVRTELRDKVSTLSARRQDAAIELADRIMSSISELRMGSSDVVIDVVQHDDPDGLELADGRNVRVDQSGIDDVSFLIAANAGETPKPIGRIASGGETARIMLAVKSILSDVDETPTLVFDEIDVGVGGRSGQMVGEKLWSLTDQHQVIVISHLAQIAAFADKHFRIEKNDSDGRAVSTVEELNPLTREEELAAMLDGVPATPESLANARAMLSRVHEYRERRQRGE